MLHNVDTQSMQQKLEGCGPRKMHHLYKMH